MQNLHKNFTKLLYNSFHNNFSTQPARLSHLFYKSKNQNPKINLIVLHGLFGASQNFRSIVNNTTISDYADCYLLDLRNHGTSEHRDSMTSAEMAGDVYHFIKEHKLDSKDVVILGHSMGARVTMSFAVNYPLVPKGVIVVDFAPYNYFKDPRFQVVRSMRDMIQRLTRIPLEGDWKDVKQAVNDIAVSKDAAGLILMNIVPDGEGKYKWKPNIHAIANRYEDLIGKEWEEGPKYSGPRRIICGEKSDYISMDILPHYNKVFNNFDPKKELVFIKDAGHWVHFQKPTDFIEEVTSFLQNLSH